MPDKMINKYINIHRFIYINYGRDKPMSIE